MAIATGTAIALGVAAGTAVGGVASARAQSGAAKHAANVQAGATRDALAYEREQDQYLKSRYELDDQREQEARAAYQQYLASQGRGSGTAYSGTPNSTSPVAVAAHQAVMQPGYSAKPAQPTIRDMAPAAPAPALTAADMASAGRPGADVRTMPTIADTSRWSDWEPYLNQNRPA